MTQTNISCSAPGSVPAVAPAEPEPAWPVDRAERRQAAFEAIESIRDDLTIGVGESEAARRLSDRSVAALRGSGLLGIMTPDDLGGNVVDPVTAFEIVERIGYIDPATAWTTTILLEGAGELATVLSDETARQVFAARLPTKASSLKPGAATRVNGGYLIDGEWDFVSGLHHADYVSATFLVDGPDGSKVRRAALLTMDQVTILDDWRVMGMRGTGSSSYRVDNAFVPDEMTYDPMGRGLRSDTPLARLGMVPFVLQMHPGMVLGAARRALDEITTAAHQIRRGGRIQLAQPPSLAELSWFQRELGELDARVAAARALCVATLTEVRDAMDLGDTAVDLRLLDAMQTAGSHAAKCAVEVTTRVFRHSGASAILEDALLAKLLRDLNTICAHGIMSEAGFETHGEFILGLQTAENRRMV